jgi:hypothetical protein
MKVPNNGVQRMALTRHALTPSVSQTSMQTSQVCARAIAFLKASLPVDSPGPVVTVTGDDEPAMRVVGPGLLEMYVVDEGSHFQFVSVRDCRADGYDLDRLHAVAVANLNQLADERMEIRSYGPIFVVLMGGNFEASLALSESFWNETVSTLVSEPIAVAVPARDVLAFGPANSPTAIDELRATIGRVFPGGDHLISSHLFIRSGRAWTLFDDSPPLANEEL